MITMIIAAHLCSMTRSGQVRSGQVRVFNCTFRASCCSACLSQVLAGFYEGDRKQKRREGLKGGGGGGWTACAGRYKGVQAVQPELVAGGGCL